MSFAVSAVLGLTVAVPADANSGPALEIVPAGQYGLEVSPGVGLERAPSLAAGSVHPDDPVQSPWLVEPGNWTDVKGQDMPLRHGNSSFGFVKMSTKHNLYDISAVDAVVRGGTYKVNDDGRAGPTYVGVIFVRQDPVVHVTIIVGGTYDKYSYALGSNSPDGRPVGVLTAYCDKTDTAEAAQQCPSWVDSY